VEALFEGEPANVDEVIKWCHIGPPKAHVDHVNVKFEKYSGEFVDFDVSY
jgi:acylphosphatase